MLFSKISLLPKNKKDKLDQLVKFIFFKELLEIILLVVALLSIILLWGWHTIQQQFNNLSESAMLVNKEFSHYNQEIRKVNLLFKNFSATNKNYSPLSPKLIDLATKLPPDIRITSLSLRREDGTFVLSGIAKTREALLAYQTNLNKIEWLSQLQTPNSQLFQKENINFEFKGNLKNLPNIEPQPATRPVNIRN